MRPAWADRLKAATASYHKEIEQVMFPGHFTAMDKNWLTYNLTVFYGFYAMAENALNQAATQNTAIKAFLEDIEWFTQRQRAALLQRDLEAVCHIESKSLTMASLQQVKFVTVADVVGYLYVVEGSTMGGQRIAQQLEEKGLSVSYFTPYGYNPMPQWQAFLHHANQHLHHVEHLSDETAPLPEATVHRLVQNAVHTFQGLMDWGKHIQSLEPAPAVVG